MRRLGLLLLVLAVAACSGGDGADSPDSQLLTKPAFSGRVASTIITETDLEAEVRFGLIVFVQEAAGSDWIRLDLQKQYDDYRRNPGRLGMIAAGVARETQARLQAGITDTPFEEVRADIFPVLKPPFALRRLAEPARRPFLAGLSVVYGVQTEDQFTFITQADVARWGRSVQELDQLALDNLARDTRENEALLCEDELCGWASGDGYDATRMIVPQLRRDIVEEIGPAVYAVPREDVFVALPVRLAERIKARVQQDFAAAPNPISPEIFVERNGKLVTLEA
ncbi:MAG: hypothetical protein ACRDM8_00050 [Gaiellaceae bacterium]